MDQAGCRAVLTCQAHEALVASVAPDVTVIVADETPTRAAVPADPMPTVDPSWPAYVIFTSGTTGKPKGVVVPHRSAASRLAWQQKVFTVDTATPVLMTFSPAFDASVWQIFGTVNHGGCCVMVPQGVQGDPRVLLDLLVTEQIPVLKTVPPMLDLLLSTEGVEALHSSLQRIGCGGEELPGELYRRCTEILPDVRLYNIYGPTESTICALHWAGPLDHGPTPLGAPVDDVLATVVAQDLAPVSDGTLGEVCIGGDSLALGYLDDPRTTAARFLPDPDGRQGGRLYATGDRGWVVDGEFHFAGRRDRQVQIRGYRVELDEVERAMKSVLGTTPIPLT